VTARGSTLLQLHGRQLLPRPRPRQAALIETRRGPLRCLGPAPGEVSSAEGTHGPEGGTMTSDAIVLLKDDHKEIRRLFREFQGAGGKAVK